MDALSVIGALPGMKLKQVCEAVGQADGFIIIANLSARQKRRLHILILLRR